MIQQCRRGQAFESRYDGGAKTSDSCNGIDGGGDYKFGDPGGFKVPLQYVGFPRCHHPGGQGRILG
jgi:hypothetical protein